MRKFTLSLLGPLVLFFAAWVEATEWPQELSASDGSVVLIYQPQIETFSGNNLEGRAAVSVKSAATGNAPVFGAIWIVAELDIDRDTRTAIIRDVEVTDVRFSDASDDERAALAALIESNVGGTQMRISVDQLLADLDAQSGEFEEVALKHEAPEIILSRQPAMLISVDGSPVFQDIDGSNYQRVVNSPFLIVNNGSRLYLYIGSNAWYQAGEITGPWSYSKSVPADIQSLVEPTEDSEQGVDNLRIVVATQPSELVVSDGPPRWAPVEGMDLLYMENTDSNAFLELSTQKYYLLLSGRWFRGEGISGELEWVHVPNDELPEPFSDIPADSVNAAVLSQVAGTRQAREAVLDNTIPQTAAIDRSDTSFSVEYDGEPDFAPIEDIKVQYAKNTTASVFRYGNIYYACDDGVWYMGNSATGPWRVAAEVPDAIYQIPASNPHHNVTYVKVYDVTPKVVYVGYTPAYYGSYYYSGAIVYGTGWYYNPWYGPHYYRRYPTWGFHVAYNPWTGWGFGVSWTNGPFRFTFTRHGGWWGVGGYRPYPRPYVHAGYRKTNININNTINIGGGRNRPETRPNLYDRPQNRARNAQRPAVSDNRLARPATGAKNNVLTDRSGNIYQRGQDGSWNRRDNGQWKQPSNLDRASGSREVPRLSQPSNSGGFNSRPQQWPSSSGGSYGGATRPQLERDYSARQQGVQRTQNFQRQGGRRRR
ncbi:MAG: carbohydrate-binding family V/XII [Halieaceae bacterium]|nr:carbohydrate-binding family V/XII [Halieaceae bacterium]